VYIAVAGEVLLNGVPGCDLDWEECHWDKDVDAAGQQWLFVHLVKKDAANARWPLTLLKEHIAD